MRNKALLPAILAMVLIVSCSERKSDPVDFVNPNIGGISLLLQTTVPLVNLPNSMMRIHKIPGNYQSDWLPEIPADKTNIYRRHF